MLRPRRRQLNPIQIRIIIGVIIIGVLTAFIYWDARYRNWNYSGFGPKTVWDWLELLFIPAVLAFAGWRWQAQEKQSDRAIAERRAQSDREIAEDGLRESALQAYFDRMTELLLKEKLRTSQPDSEVRAVARSRTLSVLRRLDPGRRTAVFRFLVESKLVEPENIIVELHGATLSGAFLGGEDFSGADLWGADLSGANLLGAQLTGANLLTTNLSRADLLAADLSGANLGGAKLRGADLREADLSGARLWGTDLSGANLSRANLRGAKYNIGENGTKWPTPDFNPQEHSMVLAEDDDMPF